MCVLLRQLNQLRTYLDDVRRLRFQAERVGGVVIIRDRLGRAHRRPEPLKQDREMREMRELEN